MEVCKVKKYEMVIVCDLVIVIFLIKIIELL